jgi:hypothetical protein
MFTTRPLISAAFGLLSSNIFADEPRNEPPSVEFARFPSAILKTYVSAASGTPAAKATLDSPFPDDFPPQTTVAFEDAREFPAFKKGARYFSPARNRITVYRITQVERAPYKSIQFDIGRLKKLLKERPKEVPLGEDRRSLPDYPPRNAAHTFQLKLAYADTAWGSGLFYLTQFSQEAHLDFANNEELAYVFQGLSKDGHFYVSADFRITHPKLPSGVDAKPKERDEHQRADSLFLTKQADDSFIPSLSKLREWIGTLKLE